MDSMSSLLCDVVDRANLCRFEFFFFFFFFFFVVEGLDKIVFYPIMGHIILGPFNSWEIITLFTEWAGSKSEWQVQKVKLLPYLQNELVQKVNGKYKGEIISWFKKRMASTKGEILPYLQNELVQKVNGKYKRWNYYLKQNELVQKVNGKYKRWNYYLIYGISWFKKWMASTKGEIITLFTE